MSFFRCLFLLSFLTPLAGLLAQEVDSTPSDTLPATIILTEADWDEYGAFDLWRVEWRYHSGDDARYALADFDDSSWETISPALRPDGLPKEGWKGVGWFRLHVVVDSAFTHRSLGLLGEETDGARIYYDGVLTADEVLYRVPRELFSGEPGRHVLAVRYESANVEELHRSGRSAGFFFRLVDFDGTIDMLLRQRSEQMFFTALVLAFAILHLILFLFSPSAKANLYYTIFLVATAAAVYFDIQSAFLSADPQTLERFLVYHRALVPFTIVFFLRFLYAVFYPKCPRQFWVLAGLMAVVWVIIVQSPQEQYDYYVYGSTIITLEMIRVMVMAIRKKKPGAWTFGIGLILVGVFSAYDSLLDLGLMQPIAHVTNAYYFGFFGMVVTMSIHLARDYTTTSKRLVEQVKRTQEEEVARRLVEADNVRKTRELEDARQLQLSMLPTCLNNIPGLDICFHMKTATEVGGDYYDYRREKDGSLVIAVGDATGHGMKAGTMVSIVKSLFITHPLFDDLPAFLRKSSDAIRGMKLGNLYMGLTLARLKGDLLTVATAGMPPVFVHKGANGSVEEILIKSMPLGGPARGPYEERETKLAVGDTALFMSDGLAEQFNDEQEMFDYPRVKKIFAESIGRSATEIAHGLEERGIAWAGEKGLSDDITLVVVKRKGE